LRHQVQFTIVTLSLLAFAVATPSAHAQVLRFVPHAVARDAADTAGTAIPPQAARIDLPLLDLPYSVRFGARAPSMQQSLGVTAGVYDVGHRAIERAWGTHTLLAKTTITSVDLFGIAIPGADAWLHEEWHRAVLGNRGVNSQNDVYLLNLDASTISVSHVTDEDLAAMKREHPAEFVRLKAAGIEGEYSLVTRMEREHFYNGATAWNTGLYWLTTIGAVAYVSDTTGQDASTDEMNAKEPTVKVRDISGMDFTAWVRDLFRPNEAWEARGVHPSGVGVNRYMKTTDLTLDERAYLHGEGRLAFLNFVDPNLLGIDGFTVWAPDGGEPLRMNLALRHFLTSFGHTIDANVFLKRGTTNGFVVLHAYDNDARTLAGLDAELIDQPYTVANRRVELSPRLAVWMQPARQAFRTRDASAGGLAALRIRGTISQGLGALVEVEAKTPGWVAGVAQLDRAVNVRIGVSTIP
jgi:hypothetical protein